MSIHGALSVGVLSKNVRGYEVVDVSSSDVTLTASQARNAVLVFGGATVARTVNMAVDAKHPAIVALFNYGLAAVTFEFAANPGNGVTVPPGSGSMVLVDDANGAMLDLLMGYART